MDTECSSDLKEATKKYETDFQLAPPHMHRQNVAEQAIIAKKNVSSLDSQRQIQIY